MPIPINNPPNHVNVLWSQTINLHITIRSARQFMNRKSNGKSLPSEKTGERVGIEGYHG